MSADGLRKDIPQSHLTPTAIDNSLVIPQEILASADNDTGLPNRVFEGKKLDRHSAVVPIHDRQTLNAIQGQVALAVSLPIEGQRPIGEAFTYTSAGDSTVNRVPVPNGFGARAFGRDARHGAPPPSKGGKRSQSRRTCPPRYWEPHQCDLLGLFA